MIPVLDDGRRLWQAAELQCSVNDAVELLRNGGTRVLATLLDNGSAFVVLDEAALQAGIVHVPLPTFFTASQMAHALQAAGVDTLVAAAPAAARWPALPWATETVAGESLAVARMPSKAVPLPIDTAKVTFTSGSTGEPRGVCLSAQAMRRVASSLVESMAPLGIARHLNALPFAVLLENVAGLMAPRRYGATVVTRPLAELGLSGSSGFDAARFDACVRLLRPHSLILLPQMLRAWCAHLQRSGQRASKSLKFVAVGGAAVGAALIDAAHALGVPAGEGYGLSEGASVQTLNLPGSERRGSAGRVLPHARMRVADDGELHVAGSLFCGYLGDPTPAPAWWPTGDLGRIDDDGFVHVMGRKKNVLITSFGRNVAPEWVEAALHGQAALRQAVVFGDGQPSLRAVLWPADRGIGDQALQSAVDAANATLPDYARVAAWVRARVAFDASTGLATANGRPQRAAILQAHADVIDPAAVELSSTVIETRT